MAIHLGVIFTILNNYYFVGIPPSLFQPELITRDSTVASAGCTKDQEAMLSLNAVSHQGLFQGVGGASPPD